MKSLITEFSFGFALTNELVKRFSTPQSGAPVFLNQYQEGRSGGGYDVKIRAVEPIFLQFKLSDHLVRTTAMDAAGLGVPHYRFHIRSPHYSPQHQLLLDLETKYPSVYYAAPRFHLPEELDDAFVTGAVVARTAFMHPSAVGVLNDNREHTVAFQQSGNVGILRSEPQEIEFADFEADHREDRMQRLAATRVRQGWDQLNRELSESIIEIAKQRRAKVDERLEQLERDVPYKRDRAAVARYVAMSLMGCELLYALGPEDVATADQGVVEN